MKTVAVIGRNLTAGGNQRSAANISLMLEKKYKVYYIVFDSKDKFIEHGGQLIDLRTPASGNILRKIYNNIRRVLLIRHYIRRYKIDTVYTFLDKYNILNFISLPNNCRRISSCRDCGDLCGNTEQYKKIVDSSDALICNSRYMAEYYAEHYPEDRNKVFLLYNALNTEVISAKTAEKPDSVFLDFAEKHFVIAAVGRLCAEKGFNHLLRSFELVREKIENAGLLIIGGGELENSISQMRSRSKYKEDIFLAGNQTNPYKYLVRSSLFVLSSVSEGFPNVVIEAMACGLPVIAANCRSGPAEILERDYCGIPDIKEYTECEYGILTPAFEKDESFTYDSFSQEEIQLAKAVSFLAEDTDRLNYYSGVSVKRCKDFSFETTSRMLFSLLEFSNSASAESDVRQFEREPKNMIKTKEDLNYYLECDRIALGISRKTPRIIGDEIWKFERLMRKLEFSVNNRRRLRSLFLRLRYRKLSMRLGFSIPYAVAGPGLSIAHYGTIVISTECKIGENCRIHAGVNIGANGGEKKAAKIGDNVYIGPGAKIVGNINIGNNVCIGANAVVVKDVEDNITVGGIPAHKISDSNSEKHLKKATEIIKGER